jgi:hypothetical protein
MKLRRRRRVDLAGGWAGRSALYGAILRRLILDVIGAWSAMKSVTKVLRQYAKTREGRVIAVKNTEVKI